MTTKRPEEFIQSRTESTSSGPDFPGSSGDRERGKFRPSDTPRLTRVAVAGDDGQAVVATTDELLGEILAWIQASVKAQVLASAGEEFTLEDLDIPRS